MLDTKWSRDEEFETIQESYAVDLNSQKYLGVGWNDLNFGIGIVKVLMMK